MFCQNCGMLKINCICKKYNESDMNGNENHELNEEAKTDFSSDIQIIKTEKSPDDTEKESQVNSRQGKIQKTIKENYYANKCFFSCRGVTLGRGLVDSSEGEAEIKKAMLSCSESAIFLCDKNKIGKIGVPRISGLDGIDCFITDAQLTDEWQVALAEQDVKLVEVEK